MSFHVLFTYNCNRQEVSKVEELKIYLSDGSIRVMESTLEDFKSDYLDEYGNFKVGYINMQLTNMKEDPIALIFTNQIVGVQEVK